MKVINSTVIGLGRMGSFPSQKVKDYAPSCWFPLSHLEALNMVRGVNLIAVCDQNADLIEHVENTYGPQLSYLDFRDMLENVSLDLVCVATRTPIRTEIITACISKGVKALHVEKPLCNSLAELDSLETMVKDNNVILTYGTLRRYFEVYRKAKNILDSGKFGHLLQIEVAFGHGQLFWSHPHSVDLILFFAGSRKFESGQAKLSGVNFKTGKDTLIIESDPYVDFATLNFSENVTAIISKNQGMDLVLSCSEGTITVKSDGKLIESQELKGEDPYLGDIVVHDCNVVTPQGTYSALSETVSRLQTADIQASVNYGSLSKHIFLGHRLLFLLVQSHINNSSLVTLNDLPSDMCILGKTGELYA